MTKPVGRPAVPGTSISVRLNDDTLNLMSAGAHLLATIEGKHPSRAAWARMLMDHVFSAPLENLMDACSLRERWNEEWLRKPTPHNVTLKVFDEQRVMLRRFECFVQSLDWTREIYRNEAVLLLIDAHGPAFNRLLELRKGSM